MPRAFNLVIRNRLGGSLCPLSHHQQTPKHPVNIHPKTLSLLCRWHSRPTLSQSSQIPGNSAAATLPHLPFLTTFGRKN